PIGRENWRETVLPEAQEIQRELMAAGIRVTLDERDERPRWKVAEWELRGVPLRLEIGPKDIEKSAVLVARRDTREKQSLAMDGLPQRIAQLLDEIQTNLLERARAYPRAQRLDEIQTTLLERARAFREEHTQSADTYDQFKQILEGRPGFV